MIFTFYKARGMSVGSSLVEEDKLDLAKELEAAAKEKGVEFILPTDVIIADKFDAEANTKTVSADAIPDGWMVRFTSPPSTPPSNFSCLQAIQALLGVSMLYRSLLAKMPVHGDVFCDRRMHRIAWCSSDRLLCCLMVCPMLNSGRLPLEVL